MSDMVVAAERVIIIDNNRDIFVLLLHWAETKKLHQESSTPVHKQSQGFDSRDSRRLLLCRDIHPTIYVGNE